MYLIHCTLREGAIHKWRPLKYSDFNLPPLPLSRYVLNVSPPSNRTSLIAITLPSCYLRHNLQGNILSAISHDIHVYQQGVLASQSSHIKVSSQVSLIAASFLSSRKQ